MDVPDPWYDGQDEFESVYTIIERSVRGLLEALQQGEV
jgi:protein-tyrosine-phosphatase